MINYLDIKNKFESRAYTNLFTCMSLLKQLNKTICIYNNNYLIILFSNKTSKKFLVYKFINIELKYIFKIFQYTRASIFINISSTFIKFKLEQLKNIDIYLDCYHNSGCRKDVQALSHKMLLLSMYNLI